MNAAEEHSEGPCYGISAQICGPLVGVGGRIPLISQPLAYGPAITMQIEELYRFKVHYLPLCTVKYIAQILQPKTCFSTQTGQFNQVPWL